MNKTCLIDLDGTMYCGDTLIEGAKRFIDWMLEHQHPFLFLKLKLLTIRFQHVFLPKKEDFGKNNPFPSFFAGFSTKQLPTSNGGNSRRGVLK